MQGEYTIHVHEAVLPFSQDASICTFQYVTPLTQISKQQ